MNLWKHQIECIEKAKGQKSFALFMSVGTGKTRTTIEILRNIYNEKKRILRTLILAPPIVVPKWRDEILKFSKIPKDKIHLLRGTGKERAELFEAKIYNAPNCILVSNYETLLMESVHQRISKWEPEVIVADEIHKLKSHTAKRTKLAVKLSRQAEYKFGLSGTPVLNSMADLFTQFLFLDDGATFGSNYYAFRHKYFYDKNARMPKQRYFPNWQIKPGADMDMSRMIAPKSYTARKEDCLDLPPLVQTTLKVPMGEEQKRLYEGMARDFITYVEDKACVATLAITKALRLQQIASGYIKVCGEEEIPLDDNPKLRALKELLEDLTPTHKVIVWAVWKQNYEQIRQICTELAINYREIHGEISDRAKQQAIKDFNGDDSVRVIIGHPGSGGVGIELTASDYSIFYSRTFSLEHSLQAIARNHRPGSEIHRSITRLDLVTEDSIDETILSKLLQKENLGGNLLSIIKESLKQNNNGG